MSNRDERNIPSRRVRPNLTIRWAAMRPVLYRGDLALGDMNANERTLMAQLWEWATHDEPTMRPWIRREHLPAGAAAKGGER